MRQTMRRVFGFFILFYFLHSISHSIFNISNKMNPGDYPSPNSPMFGGARWPGTEPDEYRPFDTNAQYDPDFSTDSYGLSDMEPSSNRTPAAPAAAPRGRSAAHAAVSGSATKKRRPKARAQKLPQMAMCEEFAPGRTNYAAYEFFVLTRCWIDVSEDPMFANN